MRMRQSLAQLERAFVEEIQLDRDRRESLRRQAAKRSRRRQRERAQKRGSTRFVVLVVVLALTAVVVTVGMFETLYYLLG
jgi:cell division septal protein FtsQ